MFCSFKLKIVEIPIWYRINKISIDSNKNRKAKIEIPKFHAMVKQFMEMNNNLK